MEGVDMTEHEIQTLANAMARARGAVVIRTNSGGSISKRGGFIRLAGKGTADTIMCFQGKFIAVEYKDTGEVATTEQLSFGRMVNRAGGIFLVIDDPDKLMREFDILERGEI